MSTLPVLEVGGTHVTAALVETTPWRVVPGSVVRDDLDAAAPAADVVAVLTATGRRVHPEPAERWCVALPGPFDHAAGVAWFSGVGKFDALHGVDLGRALRSALHTTTVSFVHDADAFAVGEWMTGAARQCARMVAVTLGTGIGSTWLVDGRAVHEGPGVPPEGRLDLVEVAGAPLEDSVSRRAILARYARLVGTAPAAHVDVDVVDVVDVAERARHGEDAAGRAVTEAVAVLGEVLAPRAAAFHADAVVVGGSIAQSWDLVRPPLASALADVATAPGRGIRLEAAQSGPDATLIGAVVAAG